MLAQIILVATIGIIYVAYNYHVVRALSEGTATMIQIAKSIRDGAHAFLRKEAQVMSKVVAVIFIILAIFVQIVAALAFLVGIFLSGLASYVGMCGSTYSNVRVANTARTTKSKFETLLVSLRGGSIMGISVPSFAVFGLCMVLLLINLTFDQTNFGTASILTLIGNLFGFSIELFPIDEYSMTLPACALGCSVTALFNRVGGGIMTKSADMGADLVGKTEEDIPEDDARNPAVIADNVGDNVGDTAGLGADLLESFTSSIVSCMIVINYIHSKYLALGLEFSKSFFDKLFIYPIAFSAVGILCCLISLFYFFNKKEHSNNPRKELNSLTLMSAILTAIGTLFMTHLMFSNENIGDLPFLFGIYSPYIASFFGIFAGIACGGITEYYTSYDFRPTQKVSNSAQEGAAIEITQSFSVGMKSTLPSIIVFCIALLFGYSIAGEYGSAMSAVGMLSFIGIMVSVDTYGPIADNAGGIAEMAHLGDDIREITDELDSVGNSTAAIGKGFSIGSANLTTISLLISFMYSISPVSADIVLNIVEPKILCGAMIGAALSYYFSGMLIESVAIGAKEIVIEVRRQFREIPGLREGTSLPDYINCVTIATQSALSQMRKPAIISIIIPVASGFIMGATFVAGILIGAIVTSIMLAIFSGNMGGCLDNAKKLVEKNGIKGSDVHKATVIGDTVGDPLKDTSGPSLNILIKIMTTASIIMAPIYCHYNLWDYIVKILNI